MIILLTTIISFILDSIGSNLKIGLPLFTVISLIISYPYFKKETPNFIRLCGVVGLLYDVVYTDTFFLNMVVFLLIGLIIIYINERMVNNLINVLITTLIVIISYRFFTYIILLLTGYLKITSGLLVVSVQNSLLINLIYITILYLITDYFHRQHHIPKND